MKSYEKRGIKVQPYINFRTWYNGFKQRNKQNERVWNMNSKSKKNNIPKWAWLLISFGAAMVVWYLLSINTTTARAFQNQVVVLGSIKTMIDRGVFWKDISSSLISVTAGFALGLSEGLSLEETLRRASAISAAAAMREETGFFVMEDMEKLLPQIVIQKLYNTI